MNGPRRNTGIPLPGLATVLLAAAGLLVGWMVWHSAETRRMQEKLIREREAIRDPEASLQEQMRAIDAWVEDGPDAVPELLAELDHSSPRVRRAVVLALGRIVPTEPKAVAAIVRLLEDSDSRVRVAAGAGLREMSTVDLPELEPHLPRLVRLLEQIQEEELRHDVLAVLGRSLVERATYVELLRLIQSAKPEVRRLGAAMIRGADRDHAESIAAVRPLLRDPDPAVRVQAYQTLAAFGAVTLDETLEMLDSEDESMRDLAFGVLQSFGAAAGPATDRLRRLLRETTKPEHVLHTLAAIGPAAEGAVPDVLELLAGPAEADGKRTDYEQGVRLGTAFHCLTRISTDKSLVVSRLKEGLFSPNRVTSRFAAETLRAFDPEQARACVPELAAALSRQEDDRMAALLTALGGLGPEAASAIPVVIDLLEVEGPRDAFVPINYYAIETLGRMGPAAAEAVPALTTVLEARLSSSAQVQPGSKDDRWASWQTRGLLQALYNIGVRSAAAEGVSSQFLEQELSVVDKKPRTHDLYREIELATLALGRTGAGSKAAHGVIYRVLEKLENPASQQPLGGCPEQVVWALADVGVRPDETVTVLLEAAGSDRGSSGSLTRLVWYHPDPYASSTPMIPRMQLVAIRGLGLFPERADWSVPILLRALNDDCREVRIAAALALGELGAKARDAQEALRRIAEDRDNDKPLLSRIMTRQPDIWTQPLPDPTFEYVNKLSNRSLGEVARAALERITGEQMAVAAPKPE